MGNQNPYIEEDQTTQWPKEKVQKDKNDLQNITQKTIYGVTRTPLNPWVNSGARVSSSCSTCGNCRFTLVTNLAISHA